MNDASGLAGRGATAVTALLIMAAGCGAPERKSPAASGSSPSTGAPASTSHHGVAPSQTFAVGVRRLGLSRGTRRPLPTLVWYPAAGTPSARTLTDAPAAAGLFPLVVFSHGLTGKPENYASLLTRLAADGFVVVAPSYPHTSAGVAEFDPMDVANQPADAQYVVGEVLRLSGERGDVLFGRVDGTRVAAAGHSAGGFTTSGMLAAPGDVPITSAIIISGGVMGGAARSRAETLFIHGDKDQTVGYSSGRSGYERMNPPKAFLTVVGGDHTRFLGSGDPAFEAVRATVTDFLRATLYGDELARGRLPADGSTPNTRYEWLAP